jgi:hypothetical protein
MTITSLPRSLDRFFFSVSNSELSRKVEGLEREIKHLRQLLDERNAVSPSSFPPTFAPNNEPPALEAQGDASGFLLQESVTVPDYNLLPSPHSSGALASFDAGTVQSEDARLTNIQQEHPIHSPSTGSYTSNPENRLSRRRTTPRFEVQHEAVPDFISLGLISLEQAQASFDM